MKKLLLLSVLFTVTVFANESNIPDGEYRGVIQGEDKLCTVVIGDDGYGAREISVSAGDSISNPYFPEYLAGNTNQTEENVFHIEDSEWPVFKFTVELNDKGEPESVDYENVAHYSLDMVCEKLERVK